MKIFNRENFSEVVKEKYDDLEHVYDMTTFLDESNQSYVQVYANNEYKLFPLPSPGFCSFLRRNLSVYDYKIADALTKILIFESYDYEDAERVKIFHRVARDNNVVTICTKNNDEHIEISAGDWEITHSSDHKFASGYNQRIIPRPDFNPRESFIERLSYFFSWSRMEVLLSLAFLIKSLMPNYGDDPVLVLIGPENSGKSVASEFLKLLINPTNKLLMAVPTTRDDLAAIINTNYLPVFDNCPEITDDVRNVLNVLSSGGVISKRKFYSQGMTVQYSMNQPCIINARTNPFKSNMHNRLIFLHCDSIPKKLIKDKQEFRHEFMEYYSELLSGLYSTCAEVLKNLPKVRKSGLPGNTVISRICLAMENISNLDCNGLLDYYEKNLEIAKAASVDHDPLKTLIKKALQSRKKPFLKRTTKKVLIYLKHLNNCNDIIPELSSPKSFNTYLRRNKRLLQSNGIFFNIIRTKRGRIVTLKLVVKPDVENVENDASRTYKKL